VQVGHTVRQLRGGLEGSYNILGRTAGLYRIPYRVVQRYTGVVQHRSATQEGRTAAEQRVLSSGLFLPGLQLQICIFLNGQIISQVGKALVSLDYLLMKS
jgi:hypothetical protein